MPSDPAASLHPLRCGACGASIPLADADAARCLHCGHLERIPPQHRSAYLLARGASDELARATEAWRRFTARLVPRPVVTLTSILPVAAVLVGHALGLLQNLGALDTGLSGRRLVGLLGWLPALVFLGVWIFTFWYGDHGERMRALAPALAARRGRTPECRGCGAPLPLEPGAVFVRCAYCRTDSLVDLDAMDRRALSTATEQAAASAREAIEAAAFRQEGARTGRGVFAGCIAPAALGPLVWSLVPASVQQMVGIVLASWAVLFTGLMLGFAPMAGGPGEKSRSGSSAVMGLAVVFGLLLTAAHIAIAVTEPGG